MHILPREGHSLDEAEMAVDLGQDAAAFAFLSFTDSDLALIASAAECADFFDLRLAPLAQLRHPMSVDVYTETVLAKARVIVIRVLGGLDYWRYGAEQAALAAERSGAHLVIIPGCDKADERLLRLSTAPREACQAIWRCFLEGGPDNAALVVGWMRHLAGQGERPDDAKEFPRAVARRRCGPPLSDGRGAGASAGQDSRSLADPDFSHAAKTTGKPSGIHAHRQALASEGSPLRAAIVHYRALATVGDMAGIRAMEEALLARGFDISTISLASTKEADCAEFLSRELAGFAPDIVINTTSFSARKEDGSSPFDAANCVVLQAIFSNRSTENWRVSPRGIGATDLAMNIAMPEIDGRIATRMIACREEQARHPDFQCALRRLAPIADRVDFVAEQALAWARLRRKPNREKRIVLLLNDYPNAEGRAGHAVGLDGPASAVSIGRFLRQAGYDLPEIPSDLMTRLENAPEIAPSIRGLKLGNLFVALQPPRSSGDRKTQYHDAALPPDPAYAAFYAWLREAFLADALIHLGAHGTTEWLPGKAAALSADCWPERLLGPLPVIYPFIVSDPGEAAQAKRRLSAVTIGHLTPPMAEAGLHGAAEMLETLLEEYSSAADLDPRRAKLLEAEIVDRAATAGLMRELGDDKASISDIDAWLCDLKEMRVKDGLHVFGALDGGAIAALAASLRFPAKGAEQSSDASEMIARSLASESQSLLNALSGHFVPPGPSGAPSRGRIDVLPTGRNMTTLDPRQSPTVTAESLGARGAQALIDAYLQEHGDWPRHLVIDAWGSAAIRTGGEELAQAFALMGVRLKRETGSDRICGFEVLPMAEIGRPRSDITLRISGLYRDLFQHQIALFDAAIQAVAKCDEPDDENPIAASARGLEGAAFRLATLRVFGPAPQAYGTGLEAMVLADAGGDYGAAHLSATGFGYGAQDEAAKATGEFQRQLARSDALVHTLDMHETDLLEAPDYAYGLGGYLAASGGRSIYILDSRDTARIAVRPLRQELARTLRSRAANPRWIAGQMRHGHRGGAELAQTVDSLVAFAALGAPIEEHQFDMLHAAYLEDEAVLNFLECSNPRAKAAIEARFADAIRRGLWRPRRNSVAMRYAAPAEQAA
jgi:cobaltochelatase CobN